MERSDKPLIATTGGPPKRDAERLHASREPVGGQAKKYGPADLAAFGYDVDLQPLPPDPAELRPMRDPDTGKKKAVELDENGWHPFATQLYRSLQTDPSRKWTGGAQWAVDLIMVESLSRMLMPRIAGFEEVYEAGELEERRPVWEAKPLSGSEMSGLLAWAKMRGISEADRLRLRREVTFLEVDASELSPEDAAMRGDNVTAITRLRSDALRGHDE